MRESVCKMVKGVKGGHPFGLYRVSSGLGGVRFGLLGCKPPTGPTGLLFTRDQGVSSWSRGFGSPHKRTHTHSHTLYLYNYI